MSDTEIIDFLSASINRQHERYGGAVRYDLAIGGVFMTFSTRDKIDLRAELIKSIARHVREVALAQLAPTS